MRIDCGRELQRRGPPLTWRSVQWRAKGANGAYSGDGEHGAFSIVVPRSPLIPLMGLIGAMGVPAVLAGVAVHSCETPRCGFMPRRGAAQAAPV